MRQGAASRTIKAAGEAMARKVSKMAGLKTALRLVWQGAPRLTAVSIALTILQSLPSTLTLYLNKLIIDAVVTGVRSADKIAAGRHVLLLIAATGVAMLLSDLLSEIGDLVRDAQSERVTNYISTTVHSKAITVDLEAYENPKYYDTLSRVQRDAAFRPNQVIRSLTQIAQNSVNLLAVAGLLLSLHWAVALLLFVVTIPGAFVQYRFSTGMYRWQRKRTPTERQVSYFNWMLAGDQTAKEIRLFNLGPLFLERFITLREQMRRERLALALRNAGAEFGVRAIATLAVYGAYAFLALRAVGGLLTLGGLTMYYQAFQRGQGQLQSIFSSLVGLYEHNLYLADLEEFLTLEHHVKEPEHPRPVPRPMGEGVAFENVSFRYPTSEETILEDISLTIQPGEIVAFVGENGAGKTTLIKLLCRLYDPTEGMVSLDGIDLKEFETAALRREISVIFQDYVKYQLTARENIQFGNADLPPDEERLVEAAKHSGADAVISGLKSGYDTVLGKWFEGGEELSIGQWQKIALARAFLRESQIIVLDEPTSAMDARAEYELFARFRQLAAGRATVLISHRFSTVRMADCIYVLEGGKITECGTHEHLMSLNGTYARLFEMQAQNYR
jgi:ATP-binding cassette subfamily B protein